MKCPNCLYTMYNSTEVMNLDGDIQRMSLHCHNKSCSSTNISYTPHMAVFIYSNNTWSCCNYSLPMQHNDKWFILKGVNYSVRNGDRGVTQLHSIEKANTQTWVKIPSGGSYNTKSLIVDSVIFDMDFIPISTGDDMHLEANKIFNRLMKLIVFL